MSADTSHRTVPLGYRFVAGIVRLCYTLSRWRITTEGYEHLPAEGGAVITWNHHSHLDFAITVVPMLGATGRWVRFLALRELWESKTLGWVPRLARCVPVDRSSADGRLDAFRDATTALQDGDLVMVAPEGTISESFELLPFRTGPVRMAQEAGVPIIPSVSWGAHRYVTTGHNVSLRNAWRVPVLVRFGEPFHVGPDADPVAATQQLRQRMTALLEGVWSDYEGGSPAGAWWVPASRGGGAPTAEDVLARHEFGQALTPSRFGKKNRPA